jgi:carboxyl-terminal processing protease
LLPLKAGGALKLPTAAYYRPSGKNVNRYPGYTEADEWGIKPDPGQELSLTDEELKLLALAWVALESLDPKDAANGNFEDRQLAKALESFR